MPAPTISELELADDPAPWAALGFAVEGELARIGTIDLRFGGRRDGVGLAGWSLRDVASVELDGLPTRRSEEPLGEAAPAHPNGVVAIDHIVGVSPALERTVRALQAAGLDLRRVREEPTPAGAPRQAFFRLGETILEVVQEPEEVLRRAGGSERPAHFWGLALRVAELSRTVAAFGPDAGAIRPAVQPGREIATVRRSAGLALPLALMS